VKVRLETRYAFLQQHEPSAGDGTQAQNPGANLSIKGDIALPLHPHTLALVHHEKRIAECNYDVDQAYTTLHR
jgi:hypothetical protein